MYELTVAELKALLNKVSDDAKIVISGDATGGVRLQADMIDASGDAISIDVGV